LEDEEGLPILLYYSTTWHQLCITSSLRDPGHSAIPRQEREKIQSSTKSSSDVNYRDAW
jgi:hypothetical protein